MKDQVLEIFTVDKSVGRIKISSNFSKNNHVENTIELVKL